MFGKKKHLTQQIYLSTQARKLFFRVIFLPTNSECPPGHTYVQCQIPALPVTKETVKKVEGISSDLKTW